MSRIGRKPIVIPAGVTVTVDEAAHTVAVKGPKGSLNSNYHPLMTVKVEGNEVLVTRPNDEPQARSLHGLTRTNIANMVNGVVNGYEKKLEIVGVGLRCQKQGSNLVMNLGFSHQVNIPDTEDCTIVWQDPNHLVLQMHLNDAQAVNFVIGCPTRRLWLLPQFLVNLMQEHTQHTVLDVVITQQQAEEVLIL